MTENERHLTELNEDRRNKPYMDSVGKLTIGVGHNLTDVPLPDPVVDLLLEFDYAAAQAAVEARYSWYATLDPVRKAVLVDLAFNMGMQTLKGFKNSLAYFAAGDYEKAADNFMLSKWYRQVGVRGPRMMNMLRSGRWPWE